MTNADVALAYAGGMGCTGACIASLFIGCPACTAGASVIFHEAISACHSGSCCPVGCGFGWPRCCAAGETCLGRLGRRQDVLRGWAGVYLYWAERGNMLPYEPV